MSDFYFSKKLGDAVKAWEKWVFGVALIALVVVLLVAPLFMFSNLINGLLVPNPILSAQVAMSLTFAAAGDAKTTDYRLLELNSYYALFNVNDTQYANVLHFKGKPAFADYGADQTQILIMDQPTDVWTIYEGKKTSIIDELKKANNTEKKPDDKRYPKKIELRLDYKFTRASPADATVTSGSQNFTIFSYDDSDPNNITYYRTSTLGDLAQALAQSSSQEIYRINITGKDTTNQTF